MNATTTRVSSALACGRVWSRSGRSHGDRKHHRQPGHRWVAPVGSFEPTGVAKPEEVELSRATFPATSCAVGTQVAEAATCATQRPDMKE